jgi:hypothetical protein
MNELPVELSMFRDQLRDAVARDLSQSLRPRMPRSRVVKFTAPLVGAAAAGACAIALTGGASVQSADAAILRHVRHALSGSGGTILHERALVTLGSSTSTYELWVQTDAPHNYHVIKWGHEATGTDGSSYDLAATFRSLVNEGHATVLGTTTIDGTAAYELSVSGGSRPFMDGTVYVSRSDYRPLLIETPAYGGERISFETYEYLPATAANVQLAGNGTRTTRQTSAR